MVYCHLHWGPHISGSQCDRAVGDIWGISFFCLLFSAVDGVASKQAALRGASSHHTALKMLFSGHQKH